MMDIMHTVTGFVSGGVFVHGLWGASTEDGGRRHLAIAEVVAGLAILVAAVAIGTIGGTERQRYAISVPIPPAQPATRIPTPSDPGSTNRTVPPRETPSTRP
jgi:hypothetical protein